MADCEARTSSRMGVCDTVVCGARRRLHCMSPVRTFTGMVWYGKEDKIKLEPSVATGCVDGSTPMVW